MRLSEQIKQFGVKTNKAREDLLFIKLQELYGAQYFKEHKEAFWEEFNVIRDKILEEYPEAQEYYQNHTPFCSEDCICRQMLKSESM